MFFSSLLGWRRITRIRPGAFGPRPAFTRPGEALPLSPAIPGFSSSFQHDPECSDAGPASADPVSTAAVAHIFTPAHPTALRHSSAVPLFLSQLVPAGSSYAASRSSGRVCSRWFSSVRLRRWAAHAFRTPSRAESRNCGRRSGVLSLRIFASSLARFIQVCAVVLVPLYKTSCIRHEKIYYILKW